MSNTDEVASKSQAELEIFLRRIQHLEGALQDLIARVEHLRQQVDMRQEDLRGPSPSDEFVNRFARLEHFLLEQFPQLIKQIEEDTAIAIPGLAGFGEIGPGNVQFPQNSVGGNIKPDFYKRKLFGIAERGDYV